MDHKEYMDLQKSVLFLKRRGYVEYKKGLKRCGIIRI